LVNDCLVGGGCDKIASAGFDRVKAMSNSNGFKQAARVTCDPGTARVYEHGWQSWSPTTTYGLYDRPYRPVGETTRVLCYRPDCSVPEGVFEGEGLLAVEEGAGGPVHVFAARPGADAVPSIQARVDGDAVVVSSGGEVQESIDEGPGGIAAALGRWADGYAAAVGVGPIRPAPTIWCSWYQYFAQVTEADVLENLDAIGRLELPVEVVQLDDGYQAEIGDWLTLSGRFRSLADLIARIRDQGRRAGIWTAPFLVGERSQLYADHPDWLIRGASAGHNWNQNLFALDVTNPGAAEYLHGVFSTLRDLAIDFFKIDFIYVGALDGRRHEDVPAVEAYRRGVRLIREAIGPDAYLLGCGAPILPSVGLVDAMRVSADVAPEYEPPSGDLGQGSIRGAMLSGQGRGFAHGRWWVNDPDCLLARPAVERRGVWAAHVERYGGLRGSSDRLYSLDEWGLDTTRRLLSAVPPPTPFALGGG
jgi:alpha-galactosidase